MQIIGVDLHARQQSVAMLNVETGEVVEKTLQHEGDSVREFYSTLAGPVRVGIEADRFDAVVPGVNGRAGDRLPGGPSGENPRGRTAETKARSKRCRARVAVAG